MRLVVWWCLTLVLALPAAAQEIPPLLRDWQDWVLHDVPRHDCPYLTGTAPSEASRRCVWPGALQLAVAADGASFGVDVRIDAADWVALPGSRDVWPEAVSDNGQPVLVIGRGGVPAVYLQPGAHRLRGQLPWTTRPPRLAVPQDIGLVTLEVDGKPVTRLQRNGGLLTLGEAATAERAADALSVRVYRRLNDGLPATLTTRLLLDVTGSAREQILGPVLPAGFVANELDSALPARLEPDGRLRVQLRPGRWQLELEARASSPLAQVSFKLPPAPWPGLEVWSYADTPEFRHSRVEGEAVDAAQAGVPPDWRSLAAYLVGGQRGLKIEGGTRGLEGGHGDRLTIRRDLWLDFNGDGLTVADHLTGRVQQTHRLDVAAPWQLQRAAQGGVALPVSTSQGGTGVEIRGTDVDLDAGLRLPALQGAFPAAAWQLPLDGIDATLHLPPGYRLLGAPGADRSPDSWVAQWSLLDLFVVALIALLAGRLLGWPMALLAAALLVLCQHEAGAPRWTLLLSMALLLLVRALPSGRLRTFTHYAAAAWLGLALLWSLPFAADQMRTVLHPQLEHASSVGMAMDRFAAPQAGSQQLDAVTVSAERKAPTAPPAVVEEQSVMAVPAPAPRASNTSLALVQTAPQGPIQAGPGTPAWDVGNDYQLAWTGAVTPTQSTRLVIAPAWLVRLLRVLMLALLAALLAKLVLAVRPDRGPAGVSRWRASGAAALLALALLPMASQAQQVPTPELLQQLKSRLIEAPKCAPDCASVAAATLAIDADRLQFVQTVHVAAAVALPLPDAGDGLALTAVDVDGHADTALLREGDKLLLRLERGIHRVALEYRVAADSVRLRFALPPSRVTAQVAGWTLDGLDQGHLTGDGIGLQREAKQDGSTAAVAAPQAFPPYVRLTRRVHFGVDWTVHNRVERIAPRQDGFSVSLALLPGEHPLGDAARVHDGVIDIAFKSGQYAAEWDSRLDRADALELVAPPLSQRAEVWELRADTQWHLDAQGVPPSASGGELRYLPLPGEKLQVRVSQPPLVAGASVAFDAVRVDSVAGERSMETTLTLTARSTRGGEHGIILPAGAELLDAQRDGRPLSLSVRDGKLSLPLLPGAHSIVVRLREARGAATQTKSSTVSLGAAAANIHVNLDLPHDRWLLWTSGPADGPAVLYWSQLVVLLLLAWLLARYAPTPLRFGHWLLLGLGFSAFDWSAFALVALWLILLGVRGRHPPSASMQRGSFNLIQAGLAVLTVCALLALIAAVPQGLLGQPDMHVAGNESTAWSLRWFADRASDALPVGAAFSLPLWTWKLAMLAWALWLANALIGWLRWAFEAWSTAGYWRRPEPKPAAPSEPVPEPPASGND